MQKTRLLNDALARDVEGAFMDTLTVMSTLEADLQNYLSISPKTADDYVDGKEDIAELQATLAQLHDTYGGLRTACREMQSEIDGLDIPCPPGFGSLCDAIEDMYSWISSTYTKVSTLLTSVGSKITYTAQQWLNTINNKITNDIIPALTGITTTLAVILTEIGELGLDALTGLVESMKGVVWLVNNLWWIAPLAILGGIGIYVGVKLAVAKYATGAVRSAFGV